MNLILKHSKMHQQNALILNMNISNAPKCTIQIELNHFLYAPYQQGIFNIKRTDGNNSYSFVCGCAVHMECCPTLKI